MKIFTKNGFTFAELMISLVVIAVITAILYPTISELAPNNNKHLFKSAYKTIELIISEITAESGAVKTDAKGLCEEFEKRLNIANNSTTCSATNAGFTTTNGMRWQFTNNGIIYVDVNASNNKRASVSAPNAAWESGSFGANNATTKDTFEVKVDATGKIISIDEIGRQHLLDETDN